MDSFQNLISYSHYSRFLWDKNRRETWSETVDRWWNYFTNKFPLLLTEPEIKEYILNHKVYPSMRGLMTAGDALDRDNTCLYNCAYLEIDSIKSFENLMFILLNGTGNGFSVEHRTVSCLPMVPKEIKKNFDIEIVVEDSKEGWCIALRHLLQHLYGGVHPKWNLSLIRPKGAILKTFGGRASGPEPLNDVFKFIVGVFYKAQGRRLTPFECHCICCVIANSVIVGGVRRSAMISLSDLEDREMAAAKSGDWWKNHLYLRLSNNSAVYNEKPSYTQFLEEWLTIYKSHSGERGICNREAMQNLAAKVGRDKTVMYGTNPCSEIILQPDQFCNLSTIVVRNTDTWGELQKKVRYAAVIGTLQSAMTNFPFLGKNWEMNCNDERLLGVSMTGIYSHSTLRGDDGELRLKEYLTTLKAVARDTNEEWAKLLGIPKSRAITCVKPEGTTSCLAGTPSGLHPDHSEYYIRRKRQDKKDPITMLLIDQGVPWEPCASDPDNFVVFSFPRKATVGYDPDFKYTALGHLKLWLAYQRWWCEHKPSITVYYTDEEFLEIGQWLWNHWDEVSGISFLPKDDHVYVQAPFEAITKEEYLAFPKVDVDFSKLPMFETFGDQTTGSQEFACTGNGCAI